MHKEITNTFIYSANTFKAFTNTPSSNPPFPPTFTHQESSKYKLGKKNLTQTHTSNNTVSSNTSTLLLLL